MDESHFLPLDVTDLELSVSESKFVRAMIENDYDEGKALVSANIVPKDTASPIARMKGLEWANKPQIRQAIQRYTAMVLDPTRDQLHIRLVEHLRIRAFYDPEVFFYPDGTARQLDDIPKEYRICIDGISEDFKGKDAQVRVVTYKLADRAAAQKSLQELLKKGEKAVEDDIPSDAKSRLDKIFASVTKAAAEAGASAALQARKETIAEMNTINQEDDDDGEPKEVSEPVVIRPGFRKKPTHNPNTKYNPTKPAMRRLHEKYRAQGIDPATGAPT